MGFRGALPDALHSPSGTDAPGEHKRTLEDGPASVSRLSNRLGHGSESDRTLVAANDSMIVGESSEIRLRTDSLARFIQPLMRP